MSDMTMYGLFVRYKVPDWLPLIKVGLLPRAIEVRNVPTETSREVRQICFGMMVRGSAKRIVLRNAKFLNCCVLDHTPPDFSSPGIFGGEENLGGGLHKFHNSTRILRKSKFS
jgi:hypothetical protein